MFKKILLLNSKKPYSSKKLKKRELSSQNFRFSAKNPNTQSYYQKIYSISSNSLNHSKSEDNDFKNKKKITKKSISLKYIFKKPKMPKTAFQFRKITNPKLPFSKRIIEPKEVIKNRIKYSKPSRLFHDFITIQWLRNKFSENIINKSIYTLLPNNGKPVIPENEREEDKRHREMIEFLDSLKEPNSKEKYVNINPKYFFNKSTFENVLKLKKIFLEFDKDGNRRMELDEMLEMFMSNKISADINDLVELFFKGKKFKEKEVLKLYLNFHQFINFALTKDQEFRQFMRNIKERTKKEKNNKNENKIEDSTNNEKEIDYENEKDGYLPMSFNSLLDYFIDKGKERYSKEVINKAIQEMNEIIIKSKSKVNKNISVNKTKSPKNTNDPNGYQLNENKEFHKPNNDIKIRFSSKTKTLQPSLHTPVKSRRVKHIHHSTKKEKIFEKIDDEIEKINLELNLDYDFDYEKQLKNIYFNQIIK